MRIKNIKIKTILIVGVLPIVMLFGQIRSQKADIDAIQQSIQNSNPDTLSKDPKLKDYEIALIKNNPSIQAYYFKWLMELKKIAIARSLPDPSINFGYFLENIETAVGPQEYKIGFMQMIPWPGKLILQGDIQSLRARTARQKLHAEINQQLLNLHLLYYDYYHLEKTISITKQNIDLIKNWEQIILNKYKTDLTGHADLIKTQIEAIKLQDDLKTLEAKRLPLIQQFGSLINIQGLNKICIPDSLDFLSLTQTQEALKELVLENNPDLKEFNLEHQAASKTISRAKMNWLPDFSVGVDKIITGNRWTNTGQPVPESGKDPLVVMGSVSIPLWFYKHSSGIGAARYLEREAEAKVTEKQNMIFTNFESIWFELKDAERKISLYRDLLLPKSLESLRASEKAYISGSSEFINIIDAQRRFLQFQLDYEGALVRYRKATARLEALAGRSL